MPMQTTQDRHVDFDLVRDSAETVVTAATTLSPNQQVIKATVPLASANSYAITLPPVGQTKGARVFVYAVRASGSYVDGAVTVQCQDDGFSALDSLQLTTAKQWILFENVGGKLWRVVDSSLGVEYLKMREFDESATHYLYVDNTGDLRIHTAAPSAHDDGAIVGGQS